MTETPTPLPHHTITVVLTDEARHAAILAGLPGTRTATYTIPADPPLLARVLALPWTTLGDDGALTCFLPLSLAISPYHYDEPVGTRPIVSRYSGDGYPAALAVRPADAEAAITAAEAVIAACEAAVDARRETRAQERAAAEAASRQACATWAALPLADRATGTSWPQDAERYEPDAVAAVRAYREARDAAEVAAREARAAAKTAHIAARLAGLAPALAAQWADGLLCRDEALRALAAAVLDPIAPEAATRTCSDQSCPCGWRGVECLPADVYPALVALRERLPEGARVVRMDAGCSHAAIVAWREAQGEEGEYGEYGERDDADAETPTTYTADITVPDGPFTFERTVELAPLAPRETTEE